jgi:hypothetical protein
MLSTQSETEATLSADSGVDAPESPDGQERWALRVFVAYLIVAVPVLLWIGSYRWFFGDEWSFLADRSVTVDGLFAAHNNQHWVTTPVLIYRGLYSLVGLHTYWPYQLVVIALHLTTAGLLRVVMRRAGVSPWLATVAAGSIVLLGAAEDNILWAFQITFVGALAAGLGQIILADHEGPIDRRDWFGLGLGLVGLTMSGVAPSLIAGAGLVCLIRRRWSAAVLHTVPLGLVYLLWVQLEDVSTMYRVEGHPFTISAYWVWMREAATGLFDAVGHFAPLGVVFAALLIGGTILAGRREGWIPFLRRAAVPVTLVVVCMLTMTTAAPSRFFIGEGASRAGRYIGLMVALTLPMLAVAGDALVRRWPKALVVVCGLFLLPIPFNATEFRSDELLTPDYFRNMRRFTAGLAQEPLAAQAPPWIEPNLSIVGQPDMTLGWLLEAEREGKLPTAEPLDAFQRYMLPLQLGVAEVDPRGPEGLSCTTHRGVVALDAQKGDVLVAPEPVRVALTPAGEAQPFWRVYGNDVLDTGATLEITLPDLDLVASATPDRDEFVLCR